MPDESLTFEEALSAYKAVWAIPLTTLLDNLLGTEPSTEYEQIFYRRFSYFSAEEKKIFTQRLQTHPDSSSAVWQTLTGMMYHCGVNVPIDYTKAEIFYRQAMAQGYSNAVNNLAVLYEHRRDGKADVMHAIDYYQIAAIKNNSSAILNLSITYSNEPVKDPKKAAMYLERAAALGDSGAFYNLADQYFDNFQFEAANQHYLRAIKKGCLEALSKLGYTYEHKKDPNYSRAYQCFMLAKEHSNPALNNLATLYERNLGVDRDLVLARQYYMRAIQQGNEIALNNLICLYSKTPSLPDQAQILTCFKIIKASFQTLDYDNPHFICLFTPDISGLAARYHTALLFKNTADLQKVVDEVLQHIINEYAQLLQPKNQKDNTLQENPPANQPWDWIKDEINTLIENPLAKLDKNSTLYTLQAQLAMIDEFNGEHEKCWERISLIPDDAVLPCHLALFIGTLYYDNANCLPLSKQGAYEKSLTYLIPIAAQDDRAKRLVWEMIKQDGEYSSIDENTYAALLLLRQATRAIKAWAQPSAHSYLLHFPVQKDMNNYYRWLICLQFDWPQKLWLLYTCLKNNTDKQLNQKIAIHLYNDSITMDTVCGKLHMLIQQIYQVNDETISLCLGKIKVIANTEGKKALTELVPQLRACLPELPPLLPTAGKGAFAMLCTPGER